ncbi:MAG: signal recognition particle protein, partial [Waddliaceae bacterium]|nr:signal recognition particle protein [Waddliaceae bacterium]
AKEAVAYAKKNGHDVVIVDTAGRLHVDEELMEELAAIKKAITPNEVLFVANAATGQDAVTTAAEFDARVEMTGTILTMLDGNTRGGAAISITEVTKKPLKFEGIGENVEDLQIFNPESMADRILGMGDTINLVKKAQQHFDEKESGKLEEKLRKATFTYEDYLKQIQTVKKMGSLKSIMKMLPGMGAMKDVDIPEDEFRKVEAMILAMTKEERRGKVDLGISRRRRVARGSGTKIDDINRLRKSFKRAKQFFKNMPHNMKQLEKKMGGAV